MAHCRKYSSNSAPQWGQSRSPKRNLAPQLAQASTWDNAVKTAWICCSMVNVSPKNLEYRG